MSRNNFTSTTEWQEIATGAAVFTILKRGRGMLLLNETETEVNANRLGSEVKVNDQYQQFSSVCTFIKHSAGGTPWSILVSSEVEIPGAWDDAEDWVDAEEWIG